MPPRTGRSILRVQNPDVNSDSSDEHSDGPTSHYNMRGTNGMGLHVHVPLTPTSTGNSTLQDMAIYTPVTNSPMSSSLPSHSFMLDNRPYDFGRLHERRPSDSQRPIPSPTADHQRVIKVLVSSDGGERWSTVDLGDARSAQMVKDRLFSKLDIPPERQQYHTIHLLQGDSVSGPALSDDGILAICHTYGDSASSLRFSVRPTHAPLSTQPSRILPPSRIPLPNAQIHHSHPGTPQLSLDTHILSVNNTNGGMADRLLPPLPTTSPPVPPLHTRPNLSSNQSNSNGYTNPPLSAQDDRSEVSGYSGGPEDTPQQHLPTYGQSQSVAKIKSRARVNLPALPNPPSVPPPPTPGTLGSPPLPPPSTVATIGPSIPKEKFEPTRERDTLPLSLPTGTVSSSRGTNIPPPQPPPSHLPPPPPQLLASSSSSADQKRPAETNRATRPQRTETEEKEPPDWVWINRPGTSTGFYDAPSSGVYDRPGTSTGMYNDQVSREAKPSLSPIIRSTSSDGRPRDPWGSANTMQYNGTLPRQNGTHMNVNIRQHAFSPKSSTIQPISMNMAPSTTSQRSPQAGNLNLGSSKSNQHIYGPRANTNENNGYSSTGSQSTVIYPQGMYGSAGLKQKRAGFADGPPILRQPPNPKSQRAPPNTVINTSTFYQPSSNQGQAPSPQDSVLGEVGIGPKVGRIAAYGEPKGLTSSRSQESLRQDYLYGGSGVITSTASTPGIGAGPGTAANGENGSGSRLSPIGRPGPASRLPPPPNAQKWAKEELPPTPSSFPNHPYAPRSPTNTRHIQQVSSGSNSSRRSPVTQQARQVNARDLYSGGVSEKVGHPYAAVGATVNRTNPPPLNANLMSPRQKHSGGNRAHASSDAYGAPPSPPFPPGSQSSTLIGGLRLLPTPGSNQAVSTPSSLNHSTLPPAPPPQGPPPPVPNHRPSFSDPKYPADELPPGARDPRRKPPQQIQSTFDPSVVNGLITPPSTVSPTPPTRMDSIAKSQAKLLSQSTGGHTSSPAASPASPRTPLQGDSDAGQTSPRRRRYGELLKGDDNDLGEGTLKVQDFVNSRQWREGMLGTSESGTLMQHHFQSGSKPVRTNTVSSRSSRRTGSQSPQTPVARSPLHPQNNAPWNTHSDEEEESDEYDDPSTSDGANNLWQTPLVKRISRIYRMSKSLRFSGGSTNRRSRDHRMGFESDMPPALPTQREHPNENSTSTIPSKGAAPMETINLGGAVFEFRPAPEQVLDRMESFFPDHDPDRVIGDSNLGAMSPGANSGNSSPTLIDAPYNTHLGTSSAGGSNTLVPSSTMMTSAGQGGLSRSKPGGKTMRMLAGQGKRKMDRQSKDGAASDTMLRRRSTKFWGSSVKELQPAEFEKLALTSRVTTESTAAPESPGGSNKPAVTQWFKGKLLGKGTYGKVYLGFNMTTAEVFAVKRVEMPESKSDLQDPRQKTVLAAIKSESDTLRDLDHPNIVAYLGYEQTDKYFSIFLEYVPGGSIGECYRKLGRGFDKDLTRHCTRQIVDGLAYLHSKGILHRDLKADNILVDLEGVCKISDFGISKHEQENIYGANEAATTMQGSVFWMAPEVLDNLEGYGAKVDIWSLGCVVLEMCTGERPWAPKHQLAVLLLLGNKETRSAPPIPEDLNISAEGHDMLDRCFQLEPNDRPTAEELKSHPYVQKTDWQFEKGAIPAHGT